MKLQREKMRKAIEEMPLTVTITRLLSEITLYWKFMCTDKIIDQNKMNLPPPLSTSVTIFLKAEKLLNL